MRTGLAATLVAGGLLLAACTSGPASPPPSSMTSPPVTSPSVAATSPVPPLRLSDTPLWKQEVRKHWGATRPPVPIAELAEIRLVGDALLTIGSIPDHRATYRLVVSDAKTGVVRWSVTRDDPVPGGGGIRYGFLRAVEVIGDPAGDWTVVTEFERPLGATKVEEGIMGLSGKDGSIRWRIPVQRERRCSCPWTRLDSMSLGPASTTTVMVEIRTATNDGRGSIDKATRTLAYDITTRRLVWTAPGVSPETVDGGLLLVQRPKLPAKDYSDAPTTLSALDPRTGRARWDLAGRYPQSSLTYAGGDTLVVDRGGSSVLVDTATGRELGGFPARLESCGRTQAVFACRDSRGDPYHDQAMTIRRSGDTASVATVPGSQLCARVQVWRELLYCDDGSDEPQWSGAVDAAGRVAAARLPGRLEAVNDQFAVFSTGSFLRDKGAFAVYAVN